MTTKLVLVHTNLEKDDILLNSFRNDCQVIYCNEDSDLVKIKNKIKNPENIQYLSLVYHFQGYYEIPFLNNKFENLNEKEIRTKISEENNIPKYNYHIPKQRYEYFSNNLITLIRFLKQKNLQKNIIVDLLSCNLNYKFFNEEVKNIEKNLDIQIRYSIDNTGNNEYGGNWILESHNVNIKDLYFNEKINQWKKVLTVVLDNIELISDYSGNIFDKIISNNKIIYKLKRDIKWNEIVLLNMFNNGNLFPDNDITIQLNDNERIDGNFKTIDFEGHETKGIFSNNFTHLQSDEDEYGIKTGKGVIQNLRIINAKTKAEGDGIFYRKLQKYVEINNCVAEDCIIQAKRSGCFSGFYPRYGFISECRLIGLHSIISGEGAGGITGGGCGAKNTGQSGNFSIDNCYSHCNITGKNSGGITGISPGIYPNSKCYIDTCYTKGDIIGEGAGGITGGYTSQYQGFTSISSCFTLGDIKGKYSGGLCGREISKFKGSVKIESSYTTGKISGEEAGGFVGLTEIWIEGTYFPNWFRFGLNSFINFFLMNPMRSKSFMKNLLFPKNLLVAWGLSAITISVLVVNSIGFSIDKVELKGEISRSLSFGSVTGLNSDPFITYYHNQDKLINWKIDDLYPNFIIINHCFGNSSIKYLSSRVYSKNLNKYNYYKQNDALNLFEDEPLNENSQSIDFLYNVHDINYFHQKKQIGQFNYEQNYIDNFSTTYEIKNKNGETLSSYNYSNFNFFPIQQIGFIEKEYIIGYNINHYWNKRNTYINNWLNKKDISFPEPTINNITETKEILGKTSKVYQDLLLKNFLYSKDENDNVVQSNIWNSTNYITHNSFPVIDFEQK